jgi:signal transduction histidine kinase
VLSTLYGRFIEVWRQKEAIVQKNRMTRLLIRNAGHEGEILLCQMQYYIFSHNSVRTPLNSIINYLEVALEEVLDERARQHLQRSLQASKSLVFQVNDLLNLTEAEESEFDAHEDNVDLKAMIVEVIASFTNGSSRKRPEIELIQDESVPTIVRTDPSMLRQVISNLLTNAIEHSKGRPVCIRRKYSSFLVSFFGAQNNSRSSIIRDGILSEKPISENSVPDWFCVQLRIKANFPLCSQQSQYP